MTGYSERGRNGPARCGNHYDSAQWNGPSGFDGRAIYIITHVTFFAGGSSRRPGARPHETPTVLGSRPRICPPLAFDGHETRLSRHSPNDANGTPDLRPMLQWLRTRPAHRGVYRCR